METTDNLLIEWMALAIRNKKLHEESAAYYKKFPDTSTLTAIVMGSTGSILDIVLGAIDPFNVLSL